MTVRHADIAAIGAFLERTSLDEVTADVVVHARLLLLDTLGALLGGLRYPAVQQLAASVRESEPVGYGDAPFGRLVTLGTAATWLDADSGGSFHPQGHRLPPVPTAHPAPHCLPVLLHEAAAGDVDDRRILEIFLLASEVGLRCGVASSLRPGLHPHGIHGPAAAAVAATLVRGGSGEALMQSFLLGSALPLAATLAVPVAGGTVRNLWTGLGAYYGASAAQWAESGGGSFDVFAALFDAAVCTEFSVDELVGGLGTRWQISHSYFKPYACARWIHPALDAWRRAVAKIPVLPEEVETIEVETFAFAASLDAVDVTSDMHARFSLPYCLATLVFDGELDAASFLPAGLARSSVADLAARITVRERGDFSAALPIERPARITVMGRSGVLVTGEVRNARGNPSSPLTRAQVEEKFRRNVGDVLPAPLVDAVVAGVVDGDGAPGRTLGELAARVFADLRL